MTEEELTNVYAETLAEALPEGINWEISPEGEMSLELLCFILDIE
jgi:hypothetical protein